MVRLSGIILLIFLLINQAKTFAKNPPPGTGTSDVPANILIMLDNSGSMRARLSTNNSLYYPVDVETDNSGNIYVLEYAYDRIKKFDSAGNYLTSFGRYGRNCNQWRDARQFQIYGDRIYIADYTGNRLVVLDLNGGCVATTSTRFSRPNGIAVNNEFIFVGNTGSTIERFRRSDNSQYNYSSFSTGVVNWAWGMSFNSAGNRLIVSSFRGRISEFSVNLDGNFFLQRTISRRANVTDSGFDSSGNIYATEISRLRKYNSSLNYISQQTGFRNPYGMHTDSSDNIYVSDYRNHRVRKYDTNFNQLLQIGGSSSATRMSAAKKVIRQIVSNTDLTSGANFGLMEWGSPSRLRLLVPISDNGSSRIYNRVGSVRASGGTDLNYALNYARRYYTGQTRFGAVPNYGRSCAQNYIIVISDGIWGNHSGVLSRARALKDQHKVKTFAVGFALSGGNSRYSTLASAGGTSTPLYADNEAQLLTTLTDAIKQAISGKLTFTTPAVMSDVQRGDFVYQATFEYASNKQWEGSIKKHKLNTNGSLGAVTWDAAEKLNNKDPANRNIWTAGITSSGLNNFVTSNRDQLASLIFPTSSPTNTQVDNLINFIRGIDTYDQDGDNSTTDSIHKLADIYHSNLIVVGAPEASTTTSNTLNFNKTDTKYRIDNGYNNFKVNNTCGVVCNNREEVIYAGSNNGILHAFRTSDGDELWGFIPPAVAGNLERIPSTKANATNPIYGVDGSPIVKDIYYDDTPNDNVSNPRWRTILVSGLGAGGNGFFALDVTNVYNPKQIFSIKNDPVNKVITHWDSSGLSNDYSYAGGSILPEFDYRKLGETWSSPRIIRIKVDGKDRWVSVFGGGYNQAANPNYGSAVFVVDIENEGKLLKVIDIEDTLASTYTWNVPRLSSNHTNLKPDPNNNNQENSLLESNLIVADVCYNPSNPESITAEFTPSVNYTINYKTVGSLECVDTVEFDTPWPGLRSPITFGSYKFIRKSNDIINSVPADLTVITADGTGKADYEGALVYATDLEGKVTKIDLTEPFTIDTNSSSSKFRTIVEDVGQTTLFTTEATSNNGRFIYTRPSATINNDNNLWLYFGTGNTQKLQEQSGQIQNRLYGIKDKDFPNFAQVSPAGDVSKCKTSPNCPNASDLGWYVNLPNFQKLTAEPTVDKNRVYFPIYEPTTGNNACKTGKAILTGYDTKCGNSVLNVEVGTGVLSKVVVQGDNLYVGIAGVAKENIDGFTSSGNLITGKSGAQGTGGAVQTQYWREID